MYHTHFHARFFVSSDLGGGQCSVAVFSTHLIILLEREHRFTLDLMGNSYFDGASSSAKIISMGNVKGIRLALAI